MQIKKIISLTLLVVASFSVFGCGGNDEKSTDKQEANSEVLILAAASLTDALQELATAYNQSHNVKLTFSFGASGALRQQIENGGVADIFFSASKKEMDALESQGELLPNTRQELLQNEIVLVAPKDNKTLQSFADLKNADVKKVALGEPKGVPAGQYAEETLQNLGLLDAVRAKVVYGSDVRQVLAWVASGEADAGIVYATDAAITPDVRVVAQAPANSHKPIIYPAAVLKASINPEGAKEFLAFASSPEGKKIFAKYGFVVDNTKSN